MQQRRGHVLTVECRQPTVPQPARCPNRALRRAPTHCWRLASPCPRPSHSRTPRRPGSAAAPAMARLSRMTRDWGRAVHSACAANSRLGRARCPRPPARRTPPAGQARRGPSALSRARPRAPSDPNFVPAPRSRVCRAICARVGARDEAQCTPTIRAPGERGKAAAFARRTRGRSRIAFDAHLDRGSGARVDLDVLCRASPTSLSPRPTRLAFLVCRLIPSVSSLSYGQKTPRTPASTSSGHSRRIGANAFVGKAVSLSRRLCCSCCPSVLVPKSPSP